MTSKNSIGRELAIAFYETNWWENKSHYEIAEFQLFTTELCCPFDVFHEAVEKSLGRPVFTHEFGLNYDGICDEFLGDKEPPTMNEILNLIPQEKLIVFGDPTMTDETQLKELEELERTEILNRVQELEELEKTKTPVEKAYKLVYGGFPITDGTGNEYDELAWNAFYHGYYAGKGTHPEDEIWVNPIYKDT